MTPAAAQRRGPRLQPVPLVHIQPGQRFSLLANDARVYARVQHPSLRASDPHVDIVCVDCRAGGSEQIGTVCRYGREHLVFPLMTPMAQVYVPA